MFHDVDFIFWYHILLIFNFDLKHYTAKQPEKSLTIISSFRVYFLELKKIFNK